MSPTHPAADDTPDALPDDTAVPTRDAPPIRLAQDPSSFS